MIGLARRAAIRGPCGHSSSLTAFANAKRNCSYVRSALREFLKGCRSRIRPQDAGLVSVGRRRVPSLWREEVAGLAGIKPPVVHDAGERPGHSRIAADAPPRSTASHGPARGRIRIYSWDTNKRPSGRKRPEPALPHTVTMSFRYYAARDPRGLETGR